MDTEKTLYAENRPLIRNSVGWTRFVAVLLILSGASYCASLILIPMGIPMIFASLALFKAADFGEKFNKDNNREHAVESMSHFFKSFRITGITALVLTALSILGSIIFVVVILAMAESGIDANAIEDFFYELGNALAVPSV